VAEGIDGMPEEFNDIFSTWPGGVQSPSASPRRNDSMSQQGSPGDCGLEGSMDQQNPLCSVPSRVSANLGLTNLGHKNAD